MLAVQSFERNRIDETKNDGLWYRAVFQVMLIEIFQLEKRVELGKMKRKPKDFNEYVERAVKKLELDSTKVTKEVIDEYETRFGEEMREQMEVFVKLKVLFANLIEMLILLDRLAFIRENSESSNVFLVPMFDPVKSPRRWALIAYK